MKAITLWQPWATLIALGVKQYETRSWATPYRGRIAIHAAKKWDAETLMDFTVPEVWRVMQQHRIRDYDLPLGAIICIGDLTGCVPTALVPRNEQRFGNFTPGRFAWKIEHVRVLLNPIAISGKQGLWDWQPPLHLEFKELRP